MGKKSITLVAVAAFTAFILVGCTPGVPFAKTSTEPSLRSAAAIPQISQAPSAAGATPSSQSTSAGIATASPSDSSRQPRINDNGPTAGAKGIFTPSREVDKSPTYTVAAGDNAYDIVQRFGVSLDGLLTSAGKPLPNAAMISPGEVLTFTRYWWCPDDCAPGN